MNGPILGVNIGVSGALAVLTFDGGLVDVFDTPCLNDGSAGRRTINAPLIAEIVAKSHAASAALFARKCDDGRAEAGLVGLAGLKREAGL